MNITQINKLIKVALIATILMFLSEIIFSIPGVTETLQDWVINLKDNTWILWMIIWVVMFLQVLLPIPAYIILNAAIVAHIVNPSKGLLIMFSESQCWLFILVVLSAYMIGAMTAYWIGRVWGKKAILWCAGSEEDYNKWSNLINSKGKWFYALTVLLPIFPDDLLCMLVGSFKFNQVFFFWVNLIGRFIGLICMIGALAIIHSGNSVIPWSVIGWGVALLFEIILLILLNRRMINKNN